ncbi:MAG: hypothetical protein HQK53_08195 [Oligoflexia bacterium]|nr:hypothetical protein [Oligoflexia bacterium]
MRLFWVNRGTGLCFRQLGRLGRPAYFAIVGTLFFNFIYYCGPTDVHAGLLIEPFAGYAFNGEVEEKFVSGGDTYKWEYTGTAYGMRAGLSFGPFLLGGQGNLVQETWKGKDPKTTFINDSDQKMSGQNYGAFIGISLPVLRFWGTYLFYNKYKKDDDNGLFCNGDAFMGNGIVAGVGIAPIPFFSINFEYRTFNLNLVDIKVENKRYKLDNGREVKKKEFLVSLSLPLSLGGK